MMTPDEYAADYVHHPDCTGCTGDYQCTGCGHCKDDIHDYSHGYYCTDCHLAIDQWRQAERSVGSDG